MTSKSVSVTFQYLLCPLLVSVTAGWDAACWIPKIRNTPGWVQWLKLPWLLALGSQRLYATLSFITVHRIHSDVKCNETQTSNATARHDIPNHLARRVFLLWLQHISCQTLTQRMPNMHVARYKVLHGAFVGKQHFLHSARVQGRWRLAKSSLFFFITGVRCGFRAGLWDFSYNSLLRRL